MVLELVHRTGLPADIRHRIHDLDLRSATLAYHAVYGRNRREVLVCRTVPPIYDARFVSAVFSLRIVD